MNIEVKSEIVNSKPGQVSGVLITGANINVLPNENITSYSCQVSEQLKSLWTNPRTPEEIELAIRNARAAICLTEDLEKVLGFAKLEYYGKNDAHQVLYEFGSWVGSNGYGRAVYEAGRDLAAANFPYARLIAFVRAGNLKAQRIITETGGIKVGYTTEGKHIYDITRRQHPIEVIRMSAGGIWTTHQNKGVIV